MAGKGELMWTPPESFRRSSGMARYMAWLEASRGLHFDTYDELWAWSIGDLPAFWESIWQYFGVRSPTPYECVLRDPHMPGARWFPGAHVNYAEHLLAVGDDDEVAVHAAGERVPLHGITRGDLRRQVFRCATGLRELGVQPGDRVAAYVANVPEALVAFLATTSIGAVWSSCSPDFGASTVIDRFKQIEPVLLFATDG
ncbi:MAG TPA: AMP-binding protein, partial [Steroidobacteraceae bacterium]|nr:AMP-binding protein [Steroidobacteraceae bacterium]